MESPLQPAGPGGRRNLPPIQDVVGNMDTPGDASIPQAGLTPTPDVCIPSLSDTRHAPHDDELAALLARTRTVAVVGMSPKPTRTSHEVAAWLLDHAHFQLFFVNPVAIGQTTLGQPFYRSLTDLPVSPDMVDVFRRPEHVPPVVDEAIEVGARSIFMQLGIVNEEAAARARTAGIEVIQNRCLKVEYRRLRDSIDTRRPSP